MDFSLLAASECTTLLLINFLGRTISHFTVKRVVLSVKNESRLSLERVSGSFLIMKKKLLTGIYKGFRVSFGLTGGTLLPLSIIETVRKHQTEFDRRLKRNLKIHLSIFSSFFPKIAFNLYLNW